MLNNSNDKDIDILMGKDQSSEFNNFKQPWRRTKTLLQNFGMTKFGGKLVN